MASQRSLSTPSAGAVGVHFAGWSVPDDAVFVDALPIGATGKVLKTRLRERYRDHRARPADD
jgi:acyl-CoA synthetase (AMP-forming)/AMP-acid ligase II